MSTGATTLRWSPGQQSAVNNSSTPTIKNHTATKIGTKLFVFGGYDGVRNHHAVHILDSITLEWREAEVQVRLHTTVCICYFFSLCPFVQTST